MDTRPGNRNLQKQTICCSAKRRGTSAARSRRELRKRACSGEQSDKESDEAATRGRATSQGSYEHDAYTWRVAEQVWVQNKEVPRDRLLSVRHNPAEVARRRSRVFDAPVCDLNTWVRDAVRTSPLLPQGAAETVPWFDPDGGGDTAALLFLMQDPSEVATGTGFVSPDNDDPSARNTTIACARAGVPPRGKVHWNVFPHWVNVVKRGRPVDITRPPQSYTEARAAAVQFLGELLHERLPRLRAIVLLGRHAQAGWSNYIAGGGSLPDGVSPPLECPSCSPQAWNNTDKRTGRPNSEITVETLRRAWTSTG